MSTIEKAITVCRLPSPENPHESIAHLCPHEINNNGKCERCDLAVKWLLDVSAELPEKTLRIFPKHHGIALQQDLNRPIIASVISGVITINPEIKSTPFSPEQP